jgi:hypothetical protein
LRTPALYFHSEGLRFDPWSDLDADFVHSSECPPFMKLGSYGFKSFWTLFVIKDFLTCYLILDKGQRSKTQEFFLLYTIIRTIQNSVGFYECREYSYKETIKMITTFGKSA